MEEIIRVLSISDKWMTKKELAKYIGSSESTFIRYIEEIKQRWGESLTIKTSHKLGYRLENFNVSLYLNVLTDMAKRQRPPNCSMSLSKSWQNHRILLRYHQY